MIKCIKLVIMIFCLLGSSLYADEGAYFNPSGIGSSARMVRLGGIEGMSERADSVFENPAALYRVNKFSSSFFTTTLVESVSYQNTAVAFRMPVGVVAFGYYAADVDDIYATYLNANDGETVEIDYAFTYLNWMAKAAYQVSLTKILHFGVSGSYFGTDFDEVSASGANMDMGLLLKLSPFELSVVVKNLLSSSEITYSDSGEYSDEDLSSDGETESLSLDTIYTVKYMMKHTSLYGQIKTCGVNRDVSQTVAFQLNPRFLPFIKASVAYKRFPVMAYDEGELALSKVSAVATGMELDLFGMDLNYAYQQSYLSDSDVFYQQNHYFSLGFSF